MPYVRAKFEDIQRLAATLWDVDISDEDAQDMWPEVKAKIAFERDRYHSSNRANLRFFRRFGWQEGEENVLEDMEEGFDPDFVIRNFLSEKLGKAAYFDKHDQFVASEYVQKFGKQFDKGNL